MTAASTLLPGFRNPGADSQQAFRALLDAMARPGKVRDLPMPEGIPRGLSSAVTTLALALFDQDTRIWLDPASKTDEAVAHLRFHCGCPIIPDMARAGFAVVSDASQAPPLTAFAIGEPQYPERSTTLILAVTSFDGGSPLRLTGPGIKGETMISPLGLPPEFAAQWTDNHALYPSGVDVFLTAGERVMGLPRGVAIEEV